MSQHYRPLISDSELEYLLSYVEAAYPSYTGYQMEVHSPTAVTMLVELPRGEAVYCRWSKGLTGVWTLIPLYGV